MRLFMKKIRKSILKILSCFLGFGLFLGGIGGIILCFYAKNIFTVIFCIIFSSLFLSGGIFLLRIGIRKIGVDKVSKKNSGIQDFNSHQENQATVIEKKMDISNSEERPITYIETENTTQRVEEIPITDEEIPYLIQLGYEKAVLTEKNSSNPKFHRTEREENLSFNFIEKYGSQIDNLTEKFESAYEKAYKTKDLDERILLLNESLKAFEKAKKFCYSKGNGGTIYFQDMWEHLHNSQNECFSYLNNIEDFLRACIFQRDVVIPKIMDIVVHTPGILQKNIYKLLPDVDKSTIQYTIKYLENKNKIFRIKKGNSYELHINE